ncbi:MAG TPA: hypothetical protein VMW67_01480 [Desulfobacteria bacterium]|nr:hypothetical protein [Desulfobacteria bacterium]
MTVKANEKRKAKAKKKSEGAERVKEKEEEEKEKPLLFGLSDRQIVLFLLEFMLVSAVFLGVWYYIGEFYQAAVFFVARLILLLMGYTPAQISGMDFSGAYLVNFNLVPLLALAVATPKLVVRRRLEMLAIGVPILFLLHVLDIVAHLPYFIELHYLHRLGFATLVVDSLGVIGLAVVFGIWFVICYQEFFRGEKALHG